MTTAAWYGLALVAGLVSFWMGLQFDSSPSPFALPIIIGVTDVALLLAAARFTPGLRWPHRVAGAGLGFVAALAAFAFFFYEYAQHFS